MKTLVRLFAALATLLFLSLSGYAQAHEGHLPQVDGTIRKIDAFGRWMRNEAQRTRETAALAGMKDE